MNKHIKIGDEAKDLITGFQGVVTGISNYQFNCTRVGIQPRELDGGQPAKTVWFDLPQVELVSICAVRAIPCVTPKFGFGDLVKDTLSPYQGTVTEIVEFLNGCTRIGVQSKELKDGQPVESVWFSELQLELVEPVATKSGPPRTGGPMRDPAGIRSPR